MVNFQENSFPAKLVSELVFSWLTPVPMAQWLKCNSVRSELIHGHLSLALIVFKYDSKISRAIS